VETPDYRVQATVVHEMMERLGIPKAIFVGTTWGGQVALEVAINWPQIVEELILISGTFDKSQLPRLAGMSRPTLVIWAEDDLVSQLKAGYLLRDSIKTSRLEVLQGVTKNPHYDFTAGHKLQRFKSDAILSLIEEFLSSPLEKITRPPEPELQPQGAASGGEKEEKS
jgi:pimeloyl-ACP methyl ester carboxylesterase